MKSKGKYLIPKVSEQGEDVTVDANKFDALLWAMLSRKPGTFKEVVARPKFRKDGGVKRSAKKANG
jgi:hypothetical protein